MSELSSVSSAEEASRKAREVFALMSRRLNRGPNFCEGGSLIEWHTNDVGVIDYDGVMRDLGESPQAQV